MKARRSISPRTFWIHNGSTGNQDLMESTKVDKKSDALLRQHTFFLVMKSHLLDQTISVVCSSSQLSILVQFLLINFGAELFFF
jgi:hypothetical protein